MNTDHIEKFDHARQLDRSFADGSRYCTASNIRYYKKMAHRKIRRYFKALVKGVKPKENFVSGWDIF